MITLRWFRARGTEYHARHQRQNRDRNGCRIRHRAGHRQGARHIAGANIVLADLRAEPLEAARKAIEAIGVRVAAVIVDVSDPQSVAAAGKAALDSVRRTAYRGEQRRRRDAWHAGRKRYAARMGLGDRRQRQGRHQWHPHLRADDPRHGQGGHVVNTGSVSSLFVREGRNQGAYAMTKYAVLALSEALEQELAGSGIGVSVLCPGGVTHVDLRFGRDTAGPFRRQLSAAGAGGDEDGLRRRRARAGRRRPPGLPGDSGQRILCPDPYRGT